MLSQASSTCSTQSSCSGLMHWHPRSLLEPFATAPEPYSSSCSLCFQYVPMSHIQLMPFVPRYPFLFKDSLSRTLLWAIWSQVRSLHCLTPLQLICVIWSQLAPLFCVLSLRFHPTSLSQAAHHRFFELNTPFSVLYLPGLGVLLVLPCHRQSVVQLNLCLRPSSTPGRTACA